MNNTKLSAHMTTARTNQAQVTAAKYIVSLIEGTGVDIVPIIQGGAIMKLIDELGQSKKLKYICPNHEQALAMMVDAYARIKGFGIGMVTSGPGGTNLATGIACAYYDSIPCMFITGQVGMFHVKGNRGIRQRGFQETDIVSVLKSITKYAVLVEKPEDIRYEFEKALYLAKSGRPGPVLLDIPYNVQRALVEPEKLRRFVPPRGADSTDIPKAVAEALAALAGAKRPAILAGGGIRLSGEVETLRALVQALEMPVATTWGGLDLFEPGNPLYLGNVGRTGNKSAVELAQQCDVLLALGTRFTTKEIIDEKTFAKNARIIAVDIDRAELDEGLVLPTLKLACDLKKFLPALLSAVRENRVTLPSASPWRGETQKLKEKFYHIDATRRESIGTYVSPYRFGEALSEAMTAKDILLPDCGVNLMWMAQSFRIKKGQRFISAWGCSPMSYAFPAAIGACLANKDATVVVTIGDGGMQMNIQELQTVALNKIPVKIFVFNNNCYISIKHPAEELFGGRAYGTGPETGYAAPDFVKIARAYGIEAMKFGPRDDLAARIREVLRMPGPVLVEIPVDPDQFVFENTELVPAVPK